MKQILPIRMIFGILLILAASALPCFSGEIAVLKNGFSIQHERREIIGDMTRLYVKADGSSYVDVRTADIEHFETAPDLTPVPSGASFAAEGARVAPPASLPTSTMGFPGRPVTDLNQVINEASGRYRLDPDL